jgi:acyl-coenzyme A thioesterase PaaI-like protein
VTAADGTVEKWVAMRIAEHQVNTWNFAHGSLITAMAEIATARAGYDPDGPPCVAIDLTVQFIGAPKLGELLEAYGTITKRSRSLVFTSAQGMVAGKPMFFATSIQKVVGA